MGPLTDTYKNKKTRNDDSDNETFWECPTKPEKAPSLESYKDGDYWDPLTDTYKSKKTRNNDSDDETFWECPSYQTRNWY